MTTIDDLKNFKPKYDYFIGLDSDGTIFDTMNIKHNICFVNPLVKIYNLFDIKDKVKEIWIKINLYSKFRGINRFEALFQFFEDLKKSGLLNDTDFAFPNLDSIKYWSNSKKILTNESLYLLMKEINSDEKSDINKAINWSIEVNNNVESIIVDLPPISGALSAIKYLSSRADIIVLSNTPIKTLIRDWQQKNIYSKAAFICGQETGSKSEMLEAATKGKYEKNKVLMIGDSPSDLIAAKKNKVLFFPIIPLKEKESWNFFISIGAPQFFLSQYHSSIQKEKILEFESSLNAKF